MIILDLVHHEYQDKCWCNFGAEIRLWAQENEIGMSCAFANEHINFTTEEDKVKFILRWL